MSALPLAAISRGLHPIDYLVVVLYLGGVLATGWYFSRKQAASDDYFIAGRRMPWMVVGLSIIATMLSTVTYLAAPGEVIQHGLGLAIGWLSLPVAFVVVNFMWIPFFMKLGVVSIYEYLEQRFGVVARWVGVSLFVLILRLLWMATIVLTASQALAQITHSTVIDVLPWEPTLAQWTLQVLFAVGVLATVYTMLGGIQAVIWTDVAQFVALFGGAVLTVVFIAVDTGTTPVDWWQATTSGAQGHELPPLASWDITVRNTILFTTLNAVFWYGCTFLADQVAVQRYLTVPSVKAAVKGNVVNFVGDYIVMVLLALCGMALLTYYLDPAYQTELAEGITDPRDPQVADKVFPHFIANGLPPVISGLVVAALFAVAMSSLDSGINSVAAVVTIDLFRRLNPSLPKASELGLARACSLVAGLACTALAFAMLFIPDNYNIIGITSRTFNSALGPLTAMFLAGMFLRHVSQPAVVIAAVVGMGISIACCWWTELVYLLQLTDHATLEEVRVDHPGPSPFLITPIATMSTVVIAAAMGLVLPNRNTAVTDSLSWRSIVRRGDEAQLTGKDS